MRSSLQVAQTQLTEPASAHGRRSHRRGGAFAGMVIGSLAMHGVAYAALASIHPEPPPTPKPAEVTFSVLAADPDSEPNREPPLPVAQPRAPEHVVAARPALRRRVERPKPASPEPAPEELGEPDAAPEPATEPALQQIAPESSVDTGLSVAGGAPTQGQAAGSGDDLDNRAGSASPVGPQPGASRVDLNLLAKRWMKKVSEAVSRAAVREYPRDARRARLQGDVWVTLEVDRAGRVQGAHLRRSSGHDSLDRAALAAVQALSSVPAPPGALHAYLRPLPVPIRYHLR